MFRKLIHFPLVVAVLSAPSMGWTLDSRKADEIGSVALSGIDFSSNNGLSGDSDRNAVLNIGECRDEVAGDDNVTVIWTFEDSLESGSRYSIKAARNSEGCEENQFSLDTEGDCILLQREDDLGTTVTLEASFRTIFYQLDTADDCSSGDETEDYEIRLSFTNQNTTDSDGTDDTDTVDRDSVVVTIDRSRPDALENPTIAAGETSLTFRWDDPDDDSVAGARVYYTTDPTLLDTSLLPEELADVSGVSTSRYEGSNNRMTIDGVRQNTAYYAVIAAINDVGNGSVVSSELSATTQPTSDFFEQYKGLGGVEEGGCSAGGSGPGTALALPLLLLLFRRRRDA